VARKIILHGLGGAPIGSQRRKFAHHQRFDERARGLFVIGIRADVADLRIRQANSLARVTGIGENFLISGKAGIEDDFAAAPRARARGSSLKKPSIFQRKNRR